MDVASMAFSQLAQVTMLAAVVALLTHWLARDRPHLAFVLWLVVLLKCVTPPIWHSPCGAFSWLQPGVTAPAKEVTAGSPSLEQLASVAPGLPATDDASIRLGTAAWHSRTDAVGSRSPARAVPSALLLSLGLVWAGGASCQLAVTLLRWSRCCHGLTRQRQLEFPQLQRQLEQLARRLKVRRRVRLLISSSHVGPAVIGLVRPLIVLPEVVARGKSPRDLEALLAHELIHVRRGDLWLGSLQVCVRAVWWFYPLVHWAIRRSTREAERCCDEEVIGELGCDPQRYARSLLEILELKRTLQPVPAFPGMKPVEVTSQRMERIMRLGQGCHKRTPRWCWVTMLVFASCVLPGAALVVTGDETERETAGDLKLVAVPKAWPAVPAPLGYGSAGGAPPDRDRGELTMAAYALGGAADKLQQELACEPADALQLVINLVIREARLTDQPLPVRDRIWVSDDQLIVAALAAEHTRIAAALSRLQALGTTQISIRVRFVAVPAAVLNRSVDDWQLAALDLEEESGSWHDVAAESPLDRPLPSGSARPLAKADLTTTVNLPPIYKIVNSQQATELLRQWQQDQRTSLLAAPTITVFNGQTASIGASSQRPFVVGLKQIDPLRKKFEPQVRVVESGRIVRLRPLLRTAKKLWLNYDVRVSEIQAVSKTTVRAAGLTEPVTLQVPQVSTARIESAIEFEFGQTVIIGGLPEPTRGGKSHQLVLLMSATRVGLPNIDHIELELPADKLDLPKLRSHLAEPSAQVAADSIEDLRRKLNQKIPVSFSGVPLRAAVDTISVLAGVKVTFAEKEIAAEGVAMNQAVTIRLTNEISVKSALRLILEPLNLSYSLRGDAIFVRVKSRDQLYTVVYNVADILMSEQRVKPRKLSDVAAADFAALVDQITQNVAPDTWGNGAGAIEPFVTNLSLVVSQTPEVHQEVAAFLEKRRVLPQTATVGATEGAAPAADDPGRSESPARPGR